MATTDRRSVARPVTRPSAGRAAALVALTWGAAVAFVLAVAADTRIGPVVMRLTEKHGIHLGDIYATLASIVVAALITVWIVVDHSGRKRRWERASRQRRAVATEPEPPAEDEYDEHEAEPEPHPDLVDTVLIERDEYTGRHRPRA